MKVAAARRDRRGDPATTSSRPSTSIPSVFNREVAPAVAAAVARAAQDDGVARRPHGQPPPHA